MSDAKEFDIPAFMEHFDPGSPEFAAHHNEIVGYLPTACPVFHTDMTLFRQGLDPVKMAFVSGYAEIMDTARDYTIMSSRRAQPTGPDGNPGVLPSADDPPRSLEYRRFVDPFVAPKAVAAMEPRIRKLISDLTDVFIEKGEGDLVQDLAQPLTATVTMWLTGLPEDKWFFFSDPIHRMLWQDGDPMQLQKDGDAMYAEMTKEILRQKDDPADYGVIAHLWKQEVEGRPIELWEIEAIVRLMLLGGVDTTQALLGSAFVFLGRNPKHLQELYDDPSLLPNAIEEFLRFHAPVLSTPRLAMRDVKLGENTIEKGEVTLMCWAAANRDPAQFDHPNEVDFHRPHNRHMTFSVGPHRCLGSNLARLEIAGTMEEVFRRMPDFKLKEDELVFAPNVQIIYGYKSVPVTFTPGKKVGV